MVNAATIDKDEASLLYALQMPYLRLGNIAESDASTYLRCLSQARQLKMVSFIERLWKVCTKWPQLNWSGLTNDIPLIAWTSSLWASN